MGSPTPGQIQRLHRMSVKNDLERIIERATEARKKGDSANWELGDIALEIPGGKLHFVAERIKVNVQTLKVYAWVSKQFPDEEIRRLNEAKLSYSIFQAVAALPDRVKWVKRAVREDLTVAKVKNLIRPKPAGMGERSRCPTCGRIMPRQKQDQAAALKPVISKPVIKNGVSAATIRRQARMGVEGAQHPEVEQGAEQAPLTPEANGPVKRNGRTPTPSKKLTRKVATRKPSRAAYRQTSQGKVKKVRA